jgi:hypothetical protein
MNRIVLARIVLVIVTALVVVIYYPPAWHVNFLERWGDGTYGCRLDRSAVVAGVDPGSSAAKAGVRAGDVLVMKPYDTPEWLTVGFPLATDRGTFEFQRDGHVRSVVLTAAPVQGFGTWQRITGLLAMIPPTIFLVVAFLLVFLRPGIMTWSFYIFAVGYFGTLPPDAYYAHILPPPVFEVMNFVLQVVFGSWSVMLLLPFVLRFPNNEITGWRKRIDAAVWVLLLLSFAVYVAGWLHQQRSGGIPAPYADFMNNVLPLIAFGLAALILAKNYKAAEPRIRQRFGFLIVGTLLSFIAYAVYFIPNLPDSITYTVQWAAVIMPIAVAYAVLRHRVIDFNFVLNRAVVYGLLSVLVIAFVSLLDWASGLVIANTHLTLTISLFATIAIGFLLDRINRVIERGVDVVLFRRRHKAEEHLRRVARALPYASDERTIADDLTREPAHTLDLVGAALYRKDADTSQFDRTATALEASASPPRFERNDSLVRFLQAEERIVWLDDLREHADAPFVGAFVLAVPVLVRHELVAFTLYGPHRNGSQIDPDEVDLLENLALEASRAYDHVESVHTRELLGRLQLAAGLSAAQ